MLGMPKKRRTTIFLAPEEDSAVNAAARAEGVSRSEFIRRSIRAATSSYTRRRRQPRRLFELSKEEEQSILRGDDSMGDPDQ